MNWSTKRKLMRHATTTDLKTIPEILVENQEGSSITINDQDEEEKSEALLDLKPLNFNLAYQQQYERVKNTGILKFLDEQPEYI
jgi:hypothetical protein